MKKFITAVLTTAMACAMTTGVFAANCPNITTSNCSNSKQALQFCNISTEKVKNANSSKLCKNLNIKDASLKITGCTSSNKNCNLSETNTGKIIISNKTACKIFSCQKPNTQNPTPNKPGVNAPTEENKPGVNAPTEENKPGNETTKPEENLTEAQFAAEVVRLVNVERAKAGLNELTSDTKIQAAALVRSKEQQQLFSHTRPNGSSCFTALAEQGVTYRGAGENIAMGQRTPEEVMKGWMNSEGHRANILNKNFTKIGVGYYVNNGTAYWTQMFTY